MTGPEHYQAAEEALRLLEINRDYAPAVAHLGPSAVAHAILASTAATALNVINAKRDTTAGSFYLAGHDDRKAWEDAITSPAAVSDWQDHG